MLRHASEKATAIMFQSVLPAGPHTHPAPSLQRIHLMLVDDDAEFRGAVMAALQCCTDITPVAAAASRADGLALLSRAPADVMLVAPALPDGSGLEVIRAAVRRWPGCAVMVATALGDRADLLDCIEAGAAGYLPKDSAPGHILDEIRGLSNGGGSINPLIAHRILMRSRRGEPALSTYEAQALELIARGFTADEAARRMEVSRHTVLSFVRSVYARMQALAASRPDGLAS